MLDYVILGFLMRMDLSGYDIKQTMKTNIANFYNANFGSIYPSLKRLEERGLISSTKVLKGGKYKKIYRLQASGWEEFLKWLEQPVELTRGRHEYLVRIFLFNPWKWKSGIWKSLKRRSRARLVFINWRPCGVEKIFINS